MLKWRERGGEDDDGFELPPDAKLEHAATALAVGGPRAHRIPHGTAGAGGVQGPAPESSTSGTYLHFDLLEMGFQIWYLAPKDSPLKSSVGCMNALPHNRKKRDSRNQGTTLQAGSEHKKEHVGLRS